MTGKRPGRGLVVSGIVVMALAVLGVVIVFIVFAGRIDLNSMSRDVAIAGSAEHEVPGQLGFRVIESVSSDQDTMTVGVGVSTPSTEVECEVLTVRGEPVDLRRGTSGDTFLSSDIDADWTVAVVAEDLAPGEYSATCDVSGEPSSVGGERFTVGRVVTLSEVFDFAGPAFAVVAAIVLGGFVGLVGLILLIVGLVRGSRARRQPPGSWPQGPMPQRPPPQGPPSQWHTPQSQSPWPTGPPTGDPPPQPPGPPTGSPPETPSPWVDR